MKKKNDFPKTDARRAQMIVIYKDFYFDTKTVSFYERLRLAKLNFNLESNRNAK